MAYMNASPRCFSKRNYPNCSLFYSKLMDHVFALDVNKLELGHLLSRTVVDLDARFQNPPLGGFKHVECLCGTPGIVSLLKTWFFQLCMIASTLFWSNSMDTFNGLIVLRIHF